MVTVLPTWQSGKNEHDKIGAHLQMVKKDQQRNVAYTSMTDAKKIQVRL